MEEAAAHAERSVVIDAVEQYARATALLFGRLLAAELAARASGAIAGTPAAFVALIEGAVSAAWQTLLQHQLAAATRLSAASASQPGESVAPVPPSGVGADFKFPGPQ